MGRPRTAFVCALLIAVPAGNAGALPTTPQEPSLPAAADAETDALPVTAEGLRRRLAGEDTTIDLREALRVDLRDPKVVGPTGQGFWALVQANDAVANPDPPPPEIQPFVDFLRLPHEQREAMLRAHDAEQQVSAAEDDKRRRMVVAVERIQRQAAALDGLLQGRSPTSQDDLRAALSIDLSAEEDLGGNPDRRQRLQAAVSAAQQPNNLSVPEPSPVPGEALVHPAEVEVALARAQLRLDVLRFNFAALPQARRVALLTSPEDAGEGDDPEIDEAQAAAAAREQAWRAARREQDRTRRRVAEERARLLGIKEAHALLRAQLTERDDQLALMRTRVADAVARVEQLATDLDWGRTPQQPPEDVFDADRRVAGRGRTNVGATT